MEQRNSVAQGDHDLCDSLLETFQMSNHGDKLHYTNTLKKEKCMDIPGRCYPQEVPSLVFTLVIC